LVAQPVQAQWTVGTEIGLLRFRGGTDVTSAAESTRVRPHGPGHARLSLGYARSAWQFTFGLMYASPGIAVYRDPIILVDAGAADMLEATWTVAHRVGPVSLELGPVASFWNVAGEDGTLLPGALVGVLWRLPGRGRLDTVVRANYVVTGSPYSAESLPPELKRTALHRLGLSLGLWYRL
jgi:hypothetical protein